MVKVGILGNGTVGSGVIELIDKNCENIKNRTGRSLGISKVLVQNPKKYKNNKYFSLITNNVEEFFNDEPDIVVEAIGGMNPAYDYIKRALSLKKHVVTANKNVISKHGAELVALAKSHGVALHFEASVGGGMPVIRMLSEGMTGNNINSMAGILNGTTNFILSKMSNEGLSYDLALEAAQQLGFAEADPSADVLGYDAARKLAIASSISYGKNIDFEKISIEGITRIDEIDTMAAHGIGGTIKLLAISSETENGIYAAVRPVIVSKSSSLGKLENEYNGIVLEGDATGEIFLSGKGAGKLPTASAVMADILSIVEGNRHKYVYLGSEEATIETSYDKRASWFIRVKTNRRADVINLIAESFIKLYIFNQKGNDNDEVIALVESKNEQYLDDVFCRKNYEYKKILSLVNYKY